MALTVDGRTHEGSWWVGTQYAHACGHNTSLVYFKMAATVSATEHHHGRTALLNDSDDERKFRNFAQNPSRPRFVFQGSPFVQRCSSWLADCLGMWFCPPIGNLSRLGERLLFSHSLRSCSYNDFANIIYHFQNLSVFKITGMGNPPKNKSNKAANQFLCCSYMYLFVLWVGHLFEPSPK